mmetsp:Transcript_2852/g.8967  ORF Transcript_2852/g.8967 Transcript_2852/m.8967 type:complete len:232 (+) Transcript_2852:985-1680(+)
MPRMSRPPRPGSRAPNGAAATGAARRGRRGAPLSPRTARPPELLHSPRGRGPARGPPHTRRPLGQSPGRAARASRWAAAATTARGRPSAPPRHPAACPACGAGVRSSRARAGHQLAPVGRGSASGAVPRGPRAPRLCAGRPRAWRRGARAGGASRCGTHALPRARRRAPRRARKPCPGASRRVGSPERPTGLPASKQRMTRQVRAAPHQDAARHCLHHRPPRVRSPARRAK